MPGLIGAAQRFPDTTLTDIFPQLLSPMQRNERLQAEVEIASNGQWALGRLHLGILQPSPQLVQEDSLKVLFQGDLINEAELRQMLQAKALLQRGRKITQLIAALYRAYDKECASHLKGSFAAVIVDEKANKLVLINDRLGSYPLYWFKGLKRFVFASELKSVLRDPAINPTLNPRAVADYLAFGFILGDKTLAEQVRLLPAASTLTYCWNDGTCTLEQYARLDEAFQPWQGTEAEYLVAVRQAFNQAVQHTLTGEHRFGVSLSGGLDSRAILSAIDCGKTPISAYTLGVKGCADEVIARQLAGIVGAKHFFYALDEHYLEGFLPNLQQMVSLTDGMYLSHGLTEMLALQLLEKADCTVLVRGHGGELAKTSLAWPLHTDAQIHGMHSKEEFTSYLLQRLNYVARQAVLQELFSDDWWAKIEGGARHSLEESVADVHLAPADLCGYLYLHEAHRRFTVPSLQMFRQMVEVRMPFVDDEFLNLLFRSPARWRDGTRIHRAIMRDNRPALLRVRNSNSGAPANAGPMLEKLLDKANSLFKRLNLYGYRHYHNFEFWMNRRLVDSVEKVLLDADSLARKIYRDDTLRRLISETKRGTADHGYLFQILLILELWQRENLR